MEPERTLYLVACCTPGCQWQCENADRVTARLAARDHEETHDCHVTAVFPLDAPLAA